ncbi:hypothetical protein M422DRAFT_781034 [Sphaerobolus stellatus SS14]|uniref:Cytochrome P450 n=1 Tax=Sphaerobolus stellatus (strain SS14) TaxID=990650 RepID=A0A0C9VNW9_SPHS4|nr:hypothetical protein M422DRAFT_781034 [Sphaerobolus stellatus SS14]
MEILHYEDYQILLAIPLLLSVYFYYNCETQRLRHIPTIGFNSPILSYLSAIKFTFMGYKMIQEGYIHYHGQIYKFPTLTRWYVVVNGPTFTEEIRKAPDSTMSFINALDETIRITYTMGHYMIENTYHNSVVQSKLNPRNLGNIFHEINDEIIHAFDLIIPPSTEWRRYPALETIIKILCRPVNRVFVGLPLCRNQEYLDLGVKFTTDVFTRAIILNMFPFFLVPLVGRVMGPSRTIHRAADHIAPLINENLKAQSNGNKDSERKCSSLFLDSLIEKATEEERSPDRLAGRLLTLDLAGMHTTSTTLVHALYYLAFRGNEYLEPIRAEVEEITSREGWSLDSLSKMKKIDSFFREILRVHTMGPLLSRITLKGYTFSDGTWIPKGTMVSASSDSAHYDQSSYPNPREFSGFRYVDKGERERKGNRSYDAVTITEDFMSFGFGKHACPGRFLATVNLKLMLAHLVLNYDMKLEHEEKRPKDLYIGLSILPNTTAAIMLRKRVLE